MHCINAEFSDFLSYTERRRGEEELHDVFYGAHWGGSFWHANLDDARTREDILRRAQRFLGRGDVPRQASRVFVRLVNLGLPLALPFALFRPFGPRRKPIGDKRVPFSVNPKTGSWPLSHHGGSLLELLLL